MQIANDLCLSEGQAWCWIGLFKNTSNGDWSWTDGSTLDYGFDDYGYPTSKVWPWINEPNNDKYSRVGVVIMLNGNGWDDYVDDQHDQMVMCNDNAADTSVTCEPSSGMNNLSFLRKHDV